MMLIAQIILHSNAESCGYLMLAGLRPFRSIGIGYAPSAIRIILPMLYYAQAAASDVMPSGLRTRVENIRNGKSTKIHFLKNCSQNRRAGT